MYLWVDDIDHSVYTSWCPIYCNENCVALHETKWTFEGLRSSHQKCSIKKSVLRNLVNSQKNTCTRISLLINLQAACNFIKNEALTQVFSCEFFYRTLLVAASGNWWNHLSFSNDRRFAKVVECLCSNKFSWSYFVSNTIRSNLFQNDKDRNQKDFGLLYWIHNLVLYLMTKLSKLKWKDFYFLCRASTTNNSSWWKLFDVMSTYAFRWMRKNWSILWLETFTSCNRLLRKTS